MRARRALLYMPGDDMHKIQKATTLGVDCICMDMEDGVANNRKNEARRTITEALAHLNFGQSERLVRINSIRSGLEQDDLAQVLPAHPQGVVIPKVETGEQIRRVSTQITKIENKYNWPEGEIVLIALVESACGIINLREIASADARLQALIFGAEDLAGDIGAVRTRQAWEVFYARSAVVTYAAAFNLQAIDMVFLDLNDIEGMRSEALQGVQMGYSGKQIIHPNQVNPVQESFTPSEAAITAAIHVLDTFQIHQEAGRGAFGMDGKMVDAPIVKAAERVLARAKTAGIL